MQVPIRVDHDGLFSASSWDQGGIHGKDIQLQQAGDGSTAVRKLQIKTNEVVPAAIHLNGNRSPLARFLKDGHMTVPGETGSFYWDGKQMDLEEVCGRHACDADLLMSMPIDWCKPNGWEHSQINCALSETPVGADTITMNNDDPGFRAGGDGLHLGIGENMTERIKIATRIRKYFKEQTNGPPFLTQNRRSQTWLTTCKLRMQKDRRPILPLLEDKYTAQVYAESLGIPTIPLLAVVTRTQDIPWDALPVRYVIKTNHWSGKVWINLDGEDQMSGSDSLKKRPFNRTLVSLEIDAILQLHWVEGEWAAHVIAPVCILVQEYIPQALDLKAFQFHGQPGMYQLYSLANHEFMQLYSCGGSWIRYAQNPQAHYDESDQRRLSEVIGDQKFAELLRYAELLSNGTSDRGCLTSIFSLPEMNPSCISD